MYSLTYYDPTPPLTSNVQGGAEEAKAFVEELLEWKAEGMMARLEGDDTKNAKP